MSTPNGLQRATARLPHHQALGLLRAVQRQAQRARDGGDLRLAGWWGAVAEVVEARCEVEPGAEALLRGRRRNG